MGDAYTGITEHMHKLAEVINVALAAHPLSIMTWNPTCRWGEVTFRHLMLLVHSPDAVTAGVFACYGTSLLSKPEPGGWLSVCTVALTAGCVCLLG